MSEDRTADVADAVAEALVQAGIDVESFISELQRERADHVDHVHISFSPQATESSSPHDQPG